MQKEKEKEKRQIKMRKKSNEVINDAGTRFILFCSFLTFEKTLLSILLKFS